MSSAIVAQTQKGSNGSILAVLSTLLDEGAKEGVLELVADLVARNEELELALARQLRGFKTTEKVSPAQLALALEKVANDAAEAESATMEASPGAPPNEQTPLDDLRTAVEKERERRRTTKTEAPAARPSRQPFPESIERVDNLIEVRPEERACPVCGHERRCVGHDQTEVLELVPARVIVRRDRREKLACDACEEPHFVRAPRGEIVVEGGMFGPSVIAQILVDKYRDGLPLHRQRERFRRLGIDLSVSTLADQVAYGAELLQPLWRALQIAALEAEVLHLDGTSLPFFAQTGKTKKKKLGALWGFVGDQDVALYLFAPSGHARFADRHTIGPGDFLALRQGLTVADAAGVFERAFARDGIIECGCNTHARRYFVKAFDGGDNRAAVALDTFQALYGIEREARELDPTERLALRQERSAPLFSKLLRWADSVRPDEPPTSRLGRALNYLSNQREPLGRFLEDGLVPIDNSIVERLHVRVAMTRKNFLFAGSKRGGQSAAIMFSILGSCALLEVDPVEYLREVLPILARGVVEKNVQNLLPRALSLR